MCRQGYTASIIDDLVYKKWPAGPTVGRTLPRRSSHKHPTPPKIGANEKICHVTHTVVTQARVLIYLQ